MSRKGKAGKRAPEAEPEAPEGEPLPEGWRWVRLDELCEIKGGITKDANRESQPGNRVVPYLRVANVQMGHLRLDDVVTIRAPRDRIESLLLRPGDILFTEGGDRDKLGRGWIWEGQLAECIFQNHIFRARLRNADSIDPRLASWYANTMGRHYFLGNGKQTTNLASISLSRLSGLPIPLPPPPVQRRIVAKLDAIFARTKRAREALDRVPALLDRYRQSLLAAACSGRLTEDWRRAHPDVEPASVLLQRIRAERRRRWEEAELAKLTARGKPPKDDRWKSKYIEPPPVDTTDLPDLPDTWTWASVDQIAWRCDYGTSGRCSEAPVGVPVLRMNNITVSRLDTGSLKYLPTDHPDLPETLLTDGDILFNRTNSVELVGKTAVFRSELSPCSFASYLLRLRLVPPIVPEVVVAWISSPFGRAWVKQVVTQQVGQANINSSKLRALHIPVPPLDEQIELHRRLAAGLNNLHARSVETTSLSNRGATLERSALAAAFRGELVPP